MAKESVSILPDAVVEAIKESVKTAVITVEDKPYLTDQVVLPPAEPLPDPVIIHTLSGVVEFVEQERNAADDIAAVHVVDHTVVRVIGAREGRHQKRAIIAQAGAIGCTKFPYGTWLDAEDFIIKLQTSFAPSADVNGILSIVGNITDENVKTASDDGVSQKVTTRKGISLGEETKVPNPVRLRPFRTFAEITQPASLFVLRLQRNEGELPDIALFEVGDLQWQIEAIHAIKDFLSGSIEGIPVIA